MITCRSNLVLAVIFVALAQSPASANVLREMTREQKLSASDLVVVAKPTNCRPLRRNDRTAPCTLRVVETIKGVPMKTVTFNRASVIAEQTVACCRQSHSYLLYLRRQAGMWWSVNGGFGVRDLGTMVSAK
jgi:hypothetical protein